MASSNNEKLGPLLLLAARNKSDIDLGKVLKEEPNLVKYSDRQGNTALHWLLSKGCFCEKCTEKSLTCLGLLLSRGSDPNVENVHGKMTLHLVVDNKIPMALVRELVRYGASLSGSEGIMYPDLAKKMAVKYPEALEATFDNGIKFHNDGGISEHLEFDWRYLTYSRVMFDVKEAARHMGSARNKQQWQETKFLYDVIRTTNSKTRRLILTHPLVHAFLKLKSPFYFRHFGLYHFLLFVTGFAMYYSFIWYMYFSLCPWGTETNEVNQTSRHMVLKEETGKMAQQQCFFESSDFIKMVTMAYLTLVLFIAGPIILEWRKLQNFGLRGYLKLWQTWVTLGTVALAISTLWPALKFEKAPGLSWEYPWAAVATIVSSVAVMIQLQPIPKIALYLEMLFNVTTQVGLAGLCITPMFFGFFAAFKLVITTGSNKIGLFKLLSMVVNDVDYEELFDADRGLLYNIITCTLFIWFIIIMVVVVVNFLIGIAVSDVQKLQDDAATKNLSNLVSSLYLMECVLGQTGRHTLLNRPGADKRTSESKYIYQVCPDCEEEDYNWMNKLRKRRRKVSQELEVQLFEIARRNCANREWGLTDMNWLT